MFRVLKIFFVFFKHSFCSVNDTAKIDKFRERKKQLNKNFDVTSLYHVVEEVELMFLVLGNLGVTKKTQACLSVCSTQGPMFESHFRACLCFQSKTCVFSVGPKKACRALCKRYDSNLKQKTCILIQKVPCSNLPEISPSFHPKHACFGQRTWAL